VCTAAISWNALRSAAHNNFGSASKKGGFALSEMGMWSGGAGGDVSPTLRGGNRGSATALGAGTGTGTGIGSSAGIVNVTGGGAALIQKSYSYNSADQKLRSLDELEQAVERLKHQEEELSGDSGRGFSDADAEEEAAAAAVAVLMGGGEEDEEEISRSIEQLFLHEEVQSILQQAGNSAESKKVRFEKTHETNIIRARYGIIDETPPSSVRITESATGENSSSSSSSKKGATDPHFDALSSSFSGASSCLNDIFGPLLAAASDPLDPLDAATKANSAANAVRAVHGNMGPGAINTSSKFGMDPVLPFSLPTSISPAPSALKGASSASASVSTPLSVSPKGSILSPTNAKKANTGKVIQPVAAEKEAVKSKPSAPSAAISAASKDAVTDFSAIMDSPVPVVQHAVRPAYGKALPAQEEKDGTPHARHNTMVDATAAGAYTVGTELDGDAVTIALKAVNRTLGR
jgi:hypothetical protein